MERARPGGLVLKVERALWDRPRWLWALLYAGPLIVVWAVLATVTDVPAGAATAYTVIYAVLGATVGWGRQRDTRWATATVPPGRLDEVLAAARRGPVPDDEAVLAPARRLVTHRLELLRDWHAYSLVVLGLLALVLLGLALASGQWWASVLATAVAVNGYYNLVLTPRRLRARRRLLRSPSWD